MSRGGTGAAGSKTFVIHLLYDLAYVAVFVAGLPYLLFKVATSSRFRAGLPQRLGFIPALRGRAPRLWIHGVSVGEVKASQPLLAALEHEFGSLPCAVSSTTRAGYQIARKLFPEKHIFYFPLDVSFIVKRVLARVQPALIVLMELEIWPNLLLEANKAGAEVIIVNGRISERSYRGYRRFRRLLPELSRIRFFSVQNDEYRRRLLALDVPPERIHITGNLKYDGIDTSPREDGAAVRRELRLAEDAEVLVAGSTHHGEDEILLAACAELLGRRPNLRLVLAPRHLERIGEIERACARMGWKPVRRTQLPPEGAAAGSREVLILDTIGELERVYAAADMVFVGGSLVEVGGHNMLEPAGKGKAVLYGPHVANFTDEAALLERCGAAIRLAGPEDLPGTVGRLLDNPDEIADLGRRAREAVAAAKGAARANVELIKQHLGDGMGRMVGGFSRPAAGGPEA